MEKPANIKNHIPEKEREIALSSKQGTPNHRLRKKKFLRKNKEKKKKKTDGTEGV